MKTFLKNSIIWFLIIIILLITTVTTCIYFKSKKTTKITPEINTISDSGTIFSLPKNLHIDTTGSGSTYKKYRIYDKNFPVVIRSYIDINIPLQNKDSSRTLSDNTLPEFRQFVFPITINGHKGEFVTYHLNKKVSSALPMQEQFTKIYLDSNYTNTPLILSYLKHDGGDSLDDAWEMIIKTLEY